jgi:hypothetical protein
VLTGVLTWIVWLAVNPGPCHGKFNSDRFDYCLEVPGGWSADSARIGSVEVDQFSRGGSAAFVMAVQLRSGATLATYAQLARTQIEGAGLTPGPQHDSRIGDQPAVEWSLSTKDHAAFRGVQLVTVIGDTGWTVQLDADASAYDENLAPFRSMLASWHFR